MITFQSLKGVVDTIDHTCLSYVKRVDVLAVVSSHVEIVCLLSNRKPDTTVKLSVDMDDYYRIINGKD